MTCLENLNIYLSLQPQQWASTSIHVMETAHFYTALKRKQSFILFSFSFSNSFCNCAFRTVRNFVIVVAVYSIRYFDIAAKRIMKFWTHLDFVYRWTDLYKKEQKHLENLFNLTNEVNFYGNFEVTSDYFVR